MLALVLEGYSADPVCGRDAKELTVPANIGDATPDGLDAAVTDKVVPDWTVTGTF